ncbi:hypothetical protein [uncultured Cellulomonas sp.]|uniref:hypothetical protein n=1 Tax=uncultured Cellulomonas sp. TaxID=189682 RepID=UPI00262AB171|nr:hypothetical protein [uncultured Cellulomonas sp.]
MSDQEHDDLRRIAQNTPGVTVEPERVWRAVRRRRAKVVAAATGGGAVASAAVIVVLLTGGPTNGSGSQVLVAGSSDDASSWSAVTTTEAEYSLCGEQVPKIDGSPEGGTLHLDVRVTTVTPSTQYEAPPAEDHVPLSGLTLTQDDYWSVNVAIINGTRDTLKAGLHGLEGPVVWIAQDGVVVGSVSSAIAAMGGVPPRPVTWQPAEEIITNAAGRVATCDPAALRLPAGQYEAYAIHHILTAPVEAPDPQGDGDTTLTAEPFLTLAGGPYSIALD